MAVQAILPKTDLKWDDIRDTLNANGGSVTNQVSTAFKASANINPWSKRKPVPYYKDFPDYDEEWWKGADKRCGLNIKYSPTDGDIISIYKTGDAYTYVPLTEGPYRLGDFRNYYPQAEPFIRTNVPEDKQYEWDFSNDGAMLFPIQVVRSSDTSLAISDVLFPIDTTKLNVAVTRYMENPIDNPSALGSDTRYFDITGNFPYIELHGLINSFTVQYFLLSLTDKSINGYTVPMPHDANNSYLIKVKNVAKAVVTGTIPQFALSTTNTWSNVADYLSTPYNSQGGSSSPVLFKSNITNISSSTITFNNQDASLRTHYIKITANAIVNDEFREYEMECSVWNGFNGATTSSTNIASKNTKEVVFGTSEGLFDKFRVAGQNILINITASVVNKNSKVEYPISSIRILIN